jgi:hypothetical protein
MEVPEWKGGGSCVRYCGCLQGHGIRFAFEVVLDWISMITTGSFYGIL